MGVALCVGVNYYENANCLDQCIDDACSVANALARHGDNSKNFDVACCLAEDERSAITRAQLRQCLENLFQTQTDTVVFYFSGHGAVDAYGGYLCTSEVDDVHDGLSMDVLMQMVERSPAINKIIILDSCHSGTLGDMSTRGEMAGFCKLPPNTVIMAACTAKKVAYEGVFTPLLVDALMGGAMNLVGEVTPGGVYSYVDRAMGVWYQRPVFKSNVQNFVSLRKNKPPIDLSQLQLITDLFEKPDQLFALDPSYEEDKRDVEDKTHNILHEQIFKILRKYASLNLVVPVGTEYMYHAAVESRACKLTALGRYYWNLVDDNRI